jgi:hypothetical protein
MSDWVLVKHSLPPVQSNGLGSVKRKNSVIVLVWVGENGYSYREITLGYYDFLSKEWCFMEDKYSGYVVKAWCNLPIPPDLDFEE